MSSANTMYSRWVEAASSYVASTTTCDEFFERRHQFLADIAREVVAIGPGRRAPSKYILYGVYIRDHVTPIYIGQSCTGRKRLRNLVFGEGHHLATSVPPETWERVVVVDWQHAVDSQVLRNAVDEASSVIGSRRGTYALIGLTLEYMLQKQLGPIFNLRVKRRDGSYVRLEEPKCSHKVRRLERSIGTLFDELATRWDLLANHDEGVADGAMRSWGNVVFPNAKFLSYT